MPCLVSNRKISYGKTDVCKSKKWTICLQQILTWKIWIFSIATEENSAEDDHLFPKVLHLFKIARLKGIENGIILLESKAAFTPTAVCGDGCAVNLKGSWLLENKYDIRSPFSRCASYFSYGTTRSMCPSE